MERSDFRFALRLVALAGLVLLTLGLFTGVGRLNSYFQQGADFESVLNVVPDIPLESRPVFEWLPDDPDTGRPMEDASRIEIQSAYMRAWLQWNVALANRTTLGLDSYFSRDAEDAIYDVVETTLDEGWSVRQVDTSHEMRLHFYSADGSIVSFTDEAATVSRMVYGPDGTLRYTDQTVETYNVIMLLEDGNWRISHILRSGTAQQADYFNPPRPQADFVTVASQQLYHNGEPFAMRGINYYPQATPWTAFWPEYDEEIIEGDLELIAEMAFNTIRVFVQYDTFGRAEPPEEMLLKMDHLLETAAANDLKVVVTLNDMYLPYQQELWNGPNRQAAVLLERYKDDPTIMAWDLKNEPDLDYEGYTPELVNSWLRQMARIVQDQAPNQLVTIGWAYPESAANLTNYVDFVSYHYYRPPAEFAGDFAELRAAAPNKPLILGEFGLPTWNTILPNGHTRAEQAVYYADMLKAMDATDNAGFLAWTLYDFSDIPQGVVGNRPWQVGPQKHLGLIDLDGEPKPAAELLRPGADLDVPPMSPIARFFKPFWLAFFAFGIISTVLTVVGYQYLVRAQARAEQELKEALAAAEEASLLM